MTITYWKNNREKPCFLARICRTFLIVKVVQTTISLHQVLLALREGNLPHRDAQNKKIRAHQFGTPLDLVIHRLVVSSATFPESLTRKKTDIIIHQFVPICIGGVGMKAEYSRSGAVQRKRKIMHVHTPRTAKVVKAFISRTLRIVKLATLRLAGHRGRKVLQAALNVPAKTDLSVRIHLRRLKRKLHF